MGEKFNYNNNYNQQKLQQKFQYGICLHPAGPPQSFTCELQCPDTYHPGTSDRCTIMWERLPTVSCSSLHVSVSLRQPDGAVVYSDVFSPSVSSTETTPLNPNTAYTVTITAENECGTSVCYTTGSTAVEGKDVTCW